MKRDSKTLLQSSKDAEQYAGDERKAVTYIDGTGKLRVMALSRYFQYSKYWVLDYLDREANCCKIIDFVAEPEYLLVKGRPMTYEESTFLKHDEVILVQFKEKGVLPSVRLFSDVTWEGHGSSGGAKFRANVYKGRNSQSDDWFFPRRYGDEYVFLKPEKSR